MDILFFMFGLFSSFTAFDILRAFVLEDIDSFYMLRFFNWLKKDRYLEKKIEETRYSIYLVFRRIGKM